MYNRHSTRRLLCFNKRHKYVYIRIFILLSMLLMIYYVYNMNNNIKNIKNNKKIKNKRKIIIKDNKETLLLERISSLESMYSDLRQQMRKNLSKSINFNKNLIDNGANVYDNKKQKNNKNNDNNDIDIVEEWPEYQPPSILMNNNEKIRASGLSRLIYPGKIDENMLCVVPNMNETNFFVNISRNHEIPTCHDDQHYIFSQWYDKEQNFIEITDCDGRVYYVLSNGLLSQTEQKATSTLIDVSKAEQILVTCQTQDGVAAYNMYLRIKRSPLAYKRAQRLSHKFQIRKDVWSSDDDENDDDDDDKNNNEMSKNDFKKTKSNDKADINLIVLIVDSLSRANFLRSMPKTYNVLKKLPENSRGLYDVYDFKLFNIVGSGTYENAPPILTGTPYNDDWQLSQMLQLPIAQGNITKRILDNARATTLPSLWDVYMNYGGVTAFVEEGCIRNTGAIARVWRHKVKKDLSWGETFSFKRTAGRFTDHSFYNIWCDAMEKMGLYDFFSTISRPKLCFAGKYVHDYTFDYIREFMKSYPGVSRMSAAILATAHEATTLRVRTLDTSLAEFISEITSKYPNTVISIMGDHGLGYGKFSKTPAGKLEYKLPTWQLVLPSSILKDRPEFAKNLDINQRRLVTGYDVYHTLVQLKSLDDPRHLEQHKLSLLDKAKRRDAIVLNGTDIVDRLGTSLLYPVSVNRTCKDMDIPMEYCSCTNYHTVDNANSPQYRRLSEVAIHHMNLKVHSYPPATTTCLQLYLGEVEQVQIATVSASAEEQLVLTFSNKANNETNTGAETFEAILHRRNVSILKNGSRILTMELGADYQTDKKTFAGDTYVVPANVGTVWCVNRWRTTKDLVETRFDVLWMQPHGADGKGGPTLYKTTTVDIDKTWVLAWQPLVHTEPLMIGEWVVKIVITKTQKVIGTSYFYVMGNEYPGIPIVTLSKYWDVKKVHRISAYEKHRKCADPNQPLELCVCDPKKKPNLSLLSSSDEKLTSKSE